MTAINSHDNLLATAKENLTHKQPSGLKCLFFVEMWERFGFYCVQALLVLFLTKAYHFKDTQAYDLFSAASALIYATPVIGGYLADKILGFRRAVLFGTILYTIGYFLLATTKTTLIYPALALLICGNGFFKSCVSSLLGTLYHDNDPRRDSGFTIFYMGINIGSVASPIICTWLAMQYGWGYGFAAAGVGMLFCLTFIAFGFKTLGNHGLPPQKNSNKTYFGFSRQALVILGVLVALAFFTFLMHHSHLVDQAFNIFSIITLIVILTITFRYPREQRNKMLVLITLMVFSVLFWAAYTQMFTSLTLFTDQIVNRQFLGWTVPTAMFQSVNPFFIITLSPFLAMLWIRLNGTRADFSAPAKFALAIILMSVAFLILPIGIQLAAKNGLVSMAWINSSYFLITVGELCLSPVGLSIVTVLAPAEITGMMMGVWFLCLADAYALGGYLADLTSIPSNVTDPAIMGKIYGHVYTKLGLATLALGLVLMLLTPKLRKMMSDTEDKQDLISNYRTEKLVNS